MSCYEPCIVMTKTEATDNVYRILLALLEGDKHFSELLNEVKKGSLTKELRELRRERFIQRHVITESSPPKTLYSITKIGKDFLRNQKINERILKLRLELKRLKLLDSS